MDAVIVAASVCGVWTAVADGTSLALRKVVEIQFQYLLASEAFLEALFVCAPGASMSAGTTLIVRKRFERHPVSMIR